MLNRNFWLLLGNRVVTRIAYNLSTFTLLIWVFQLTGSNAAVSLWMVMFFIASVSFSLVAGVAADIYDRRKIMILANLAWGILVLGFIPAEKSLPLILGVTLLTQALDEFFKPSQDSSLPHLVMDEKLLSANSIFSLAGYASSFIGFFLSGVMLRFLGYRAPFIASSVLVLLGAIFALALPPLKNVYPSVTTEKFVRRVRVKILDQWNFLLHNRHVASTVAFMAVLVSGVSAAGALAPGFAEQVLRIDARDLSFVGVIPLAVGLLLGIFILSRYGKLWPVWQSVLGFGLTLILLASSPSIRVFLANHITTPQTFERLPAFSLLIAVLVFLLGLFASTVSVPVVTSLQRITPRKNLGRTFGSLGTLSAVLTTVLVLVFGTMADFLSPALPVILVGLAAILAAFWVRYRVVIK
ncbi:MAG: MFS transporter [Patescibacteria group bacterium]|nr:MAG: MFS transporter [Patescibacteria group bacterium]